MKRELVRVSLIALVLAIGVPAQAPVFAQTSEETPLQIRQRLEALRLQRQEDLRRAGRATAEEFRKVDLEIRDAARAAEATRSKALSNLSEGAGGVNIGQGGAGTAPTEGRGVMGDIDTRSLTPREFDKVLKAAQGQKYTITQQGDAFTIKELDVTVHRMPARNMSYGSSEQVGSSGYQAEVNRGFNQETATGVDPVALKPTDPALGVADNLKKAAHTLDMPVSHVSSEELPGELQKLGKMTQRNMDAISTMNPASTPDPALRGQAQALKDGLSPEAAGIVRPNATPEERIADIETFQNRCRDVAHEAVRTADVHTGQQMESLAGEARHANEVLEAVKETGDTRRIAAAADRARQAEQAVIEYQMAQASARESAVMNDGSAAKVMAEAKGLNTAGESPSQVREAVIAPERQAVTNAIETPTRAPGSGGAAKPGEVPVSAASGEAAGPEAAAGRGSTVVKGIGGALAAYGIVKGVQKGAEEAGKEAAENGDSALTSTAKTVGYSTWHGLGFGGAKEIGTRAGEEFAKQWAEDVKAGRVDPNSALSRYWAQARAVGWGLAEFTGLQAIKDATVEGAGYVKDRYTQYKAEKGEQNQKLADAQRDADRATAAAQKAEKDKAASDRTSAEKAAGEKSTSEKTAGDKTASEKSSSETDKSGADAEKADKAAADKAAIAKIVAKHLAEKKAAEKAAAEKAAAEKAAAEKAAAEKAAAEKEAAEQAAAQQDAADQAAGEEAGANLENQTVEAGTLTDKNGTTKLVYIKDRAGNVLGGYYIHYDKNGKEIGRESFSGDSAPDSPGNATLGGAYSGRISGGATGTLSFTVSGSQISGRISGIREGDHITADFSGVVDASGNFSASASGLLTWTNSDGTPGTPSYKFTGTVRGRVDGRGGAGSWTGKNQWGTSSGTWRASK